MFDNYNPIICYRNMLYGQQHTLLLGTEDDAAPITNAWTWDISTIAMPRADANGVLSFSVDIAGGVGLGVDANGNYIALGDILPLGGFQQVNVLVLGAARNNPGGTRFVGGQVQVLADGVEIFNHTVYEPKNASVIYPLATHDVSTTYTVTISGLTPEATVPLPEIYLGPALVMPYINKPFNARGETRDVTRNEYALGRVRSAVNFARMEQKARWKMIPAAKQLEIWRWLEDAWEVGQPMWWSWDPLGHPTETYLGEHVDDSAPMPFEIGIYASFALNFQESL